MCEYELDIEQSKSIYKCFKSNLKIKECYNNVFNVVFLKSAQFITGEWKVAYGYVTIIENILCRHCFIISEKGKVIDPTIYTNTKINTNCKYYAIKVFDDVDKYFEAIEQNNLFPALDKVLKAEEQEAWEWAKNNNCFLVG